MGYAVAGVVFLIFLVFIIMAAKNWRALHVTAVVLVFLAALPAVFMAAAQHKNEKIWRQKVESLQKSLTQSEKQQELLAIGSLTEVNLAQESVLHLKAQLEQELLYRGRVWRGCRAAGVQGNPDNLTADVAVTAPGPDGSPPTPHAIKPGAIVYVFRERDDAETGGKVPEFYLGEYTVANANETAVQLKNTLPLDPVQGREIGARGATWALYEVMPYDRHDVWTDGQPDEQHLFGKPVAERIALLPQSPGNSREVYARNGMAAQPSDPPERIWVKVEFLQKHEVPVDSDDDPTAFTNREFDSRGRARLSSLRQGQATTFEPGHNAYFDSETAQQLIADGIAKKSDSPGAKPVGPIGDVFVRELRSYDQHFHKVFRRNDLLASEIRELNRNTAAITAARQNAEKSVVYRTEEKRKLTEDLAGMQREAAQIKEYQDALAAKVRDLRSQLSQAYRSNINLSNELTNRHRSIAEAVDRATVGAGQRSSRRIPSGSLPARD